MDHATLKNFVRTALAEMPHGHEEREKYLQSIELRASQAGNTGQAFLRELHSAAKENTEQKTL